MNRKNMIQRKKSEILGKKKKSRFFRVCFVKRS